MSYRLPRDQLIEQVREHAEGFKHFGSPEKARAAMRVAEELREGASSGQVGHIEYVVSD